jgi:uncharacterized protein (TIGR02391 family)
VVRTIADLIPDPQMLLDLESEELGEVLLRFLASPEGGGYLHRNALLVFADRGYGSYPSDVRTRVTYALTEAWVWIEREGFLAPRPGDAGGFVFVTRRGRRAVEAGSLASFQRASLLPRTLLHAAIAGKVWSPFLRGEYDTAIFQAFREVEVAVRDAGSFQATDIGTALMRKAFGPGGPLADSSLPVAEQVALAHLFTGAIGWAKNPQSHRIVAVNDPVVTAELINLASYLMRIVDERR